MTANFKGGLGNLMKQAQEMQAKMQQAQKEITQMTIEAEAGAGLVKLKINGQHRGIKCTIDPSLMTADQREVLEDLIIAAINKASDSIEETSRKKLSALTGGLNLPEGLMGGDGTN